MALSLKVNVGEQVLIGDKIRITLAHPDGANHQYKTPMILHIEAPREMRIVRAELPSRDPL